MKSISEIAVIVKSELNGVTKEHRMLKRAEQLKQLYKKVKSDHNIPFFNQFLEGVWKYHTLQERRQMIKAELEYPEEKRSREKLIESAREVQYLLDQAQKKLDPLDLSGDLNTYFEKHIRKYMQFTEMQILYQQTIIYMHDGEFDKAEAEAKRGKEKATNPEDINQFSGLKLEAEAYYNIINKRWWEINESDYRDTARVFDAAVGCYSRCKRANEYDFENKTMSIPKAMISLLRFIASPTFDNISQLAEFGKIRDKYPVVQYAFRPARETASERKKQRDLIMQYLKNVVFRIAAFNIFEDLRTLVIELEKFAHKNENVIRKVADKISPDRISLYKARHPPAIENFMDDCEEIFKKELPQSVHELKEIYHDCKHKKIHLSITAEPDRFAEEIVGRILDKYDDLKNVRQDIDRLKYLFTVL